MKVWLIIVLLLSTQITCSKYPVGLPNCGNSCFMNAAIQVLYAMDGLREFFLDKKNIKTYQNNELIKDFADLLHAMDSASPDLNKKTCAFYSKHIATTATIAGGSDTGQVIELILQAAGKSNDTSVRTRFHNLIVNTLSLETVTTEESVVSPGSFFKLVVTIPEDKFLHLEEFLPDALVNITQFEGGFAKETTTQMGRYVIFQLNWDPWKTKQFDQKMLIPQTIIPAYYSATIRGRYHLLAVIFHVGVSRQAGHYYSYVKSQNAWFKCNDWKVKPEVPYFAFHDLYHIWPSTARPIVLVYEQDLFTNALENITLELSTLANVLNA